MTDNTKERNNEGPNTYLPEGTESTQHRGAFSPKYTVLGVLDSTTSQERETLEPVLGKTPKL